MAAPVRSSLPHLLIVDDEPAVQEALSTALAGTYSVHAAATGQQACALLAKHPITAIVLDAILDHEHGLDLVGRFRALSAAPILILTGHGSEELAVRAIRARADDYLKKPVNLQELHAALARLTQPLDPGGDPVEHARRLLLAAPERPHTTERLARLVGLSDRHLRRRFLETTGKTPRRYLTELRLQRAADLLRTTSLGIEQIAHRVGYLGGGELHRAFKRFFGVAPSEFRARPAPVPEPRGRGPRRR